MKFLSASLALAALSFLPATLAGTAEAITIKVLMNLDFDPQVM
jgi:hypothetical protein